MPTRQGKRSDLTSSDTPDKVTRSQAIEASGIERSQAYDLQKLAANPDVVQAVLDRAKAEGRNRGGMGPIHPDAYSMHAMS